MLILGQKSCILGHTILKIPQPNSIKANSWTFKLLTDQSICYKSVSRFPLNFPYPNGKKFSTSNVKKKSHLQIDIFCHFDFCGNRRNDFGSNYKSIFIFRWVWDSFIQTRFRNNSWNKRWLFEGQNYSAQKYKTLLLEIKFGTRGARFTNQCLSLASKPTSHQSQTKQEKQKPRGKIS